MSGVRFFKTMVVTYLLGGALVASIITATHYRRELKKSDRIVEMLTQDKKDFADKSHEDFMIISDALRNEKKIHSETSAELRRINNLLVWGHENLQIRENIDFEYGYGVVRVCGTIRDSNKYFIVKNFRYDTNDPEERDFAIREAEELIETIQKA